MLVFGVYCDIVYWQVKLSINKFMHKCWIPILHSVLLIAFPSTFSYFNMPQMALFTAMVMEVILK